MSHYYVQSTRTYTTVEPGTLENTCDDCGIIFSNKRDYNLHMSDYHSRESTGKAACVKRMRAKVDAKNPPAAAEPPAVSAAAEPPAPAAAEPPAPAAAEPPVVPADVPLPTVAGDAAPATAPAP